MNRFCSLALQLASLAFIAIATPTYAAPTTKLPNLQAQVVRVTDGDTVVLQIGSEQEKVRLIAIDTPESKHNPRTKKQSAQNHLSEDTVVRLGKLAAEHTQTLLPVGTSVRVEYDLGKRDRYGRLLAYLWLADGTMVNEEIIRSGYAYPLTIPPNVKYADRFAAGFRESREKSRGLWSIR